MIQPDKPQGGTPKENGVEGGRRTVLEEAKGVKKTWAEIKCGGGILWIPYVPQWNVGTINCFD